MNVLDFGAMKKDGRRIVATTAYDYWTARILNESSVDCILVGDSVAMVAHGYPNTLAATVDMMVPHVAAVSRGAPDKFLVADMPFLTMRRGFDYAMGAVEAFMRAGANAVKMEGVRGHEDIIRHVIESGIPVMGHIGLIPQSVNGLGGFKVQGRKDTAEAIMEDARSVEECGCFSVVLECVARELGSGISAELQIPTIGIGAGPDTDGQVLVLQDLCGFNHGFSPKFARQFADGHGLVKGAVDSFGESVRSGAYPDEVKESYS